MYIGPWLLVCQQFLEISNQMELKGEVLNFEQKKMYMAQNPDLCPPIYALVSGTSSRRIIIPLPLFSMKYDVREFFSGGRTAQLP